jgi:hypothetical protein
MEGMRYAGRHNQHLPGIDMSNLAADRYFSPAVEDIYHRIEWGYVFAQTLA